MTTEMLFYDDEFQALRNMIENGKGYKKTAGFLWPGMKPDSAHAKLKACCKSDGDERLKLHEILAAMQFNERFDPLLYLCDETLHNRPLQKKPQEEQAKLVGVIENATSVITGALAKLERMKAAGG